MGLGDTFLFQNKIKEGVDKWLPEETIYAIFSLGEPLKCLVMEANFYQNSNVPQHPLDNNSTIVDNVILEGLQVALRVVVDYENIEEFEKLLLQGNLDKDGFVIHTLSDTLENMRWTRKSYSESASSVGSVFYDLDFTETRLVEAKTGHISYKKVFKEQDASKVQQGQQEAKTFQGKKLNGAHRSLALGGFDKIGNAFMNGVGGMGFF